MSTTLNGKTVALYARYSSRMQSEASIEDQVRRCTEFVESAGGVVTPELVLIDVAISGASLARPGFDQVMAKAESSPRQIDVIVTEDISRISRDFADAADVFRRLRFRDVTLIGVADGIDTSAKHAKLSFALKSLIADVYLDDLRDKTLRGLEGRALRGYSTGGSLYGYRTSPETGRDGAVIGYRLAIDEEQAAVVRRVFELYRQGESLVGIAKRLHADGLTPPRATTRHRRKGWVPNTIRAWLGNEAFIGRWSYKRRQWRKEPGTNRRVPHRRDPSEVIHVEHPELRIIPPPLWQAVQSRRADVRACYARGGDRGRGVSLTRRNSYLLSGLLVCGCCGGSMTICGGSSAKYYGCTANKKRGTCENRLSVREDVARARILGEVRKRLASPAALRYLRKRIREGLSQVGEETSTELAAKKARLGQTRTRIAGLVEFIAKGDHSAAVREALRELEASAEVDRRAIDILGRRAPKPTSLPSVNELARRALELDTMLASDPLRGREALRRFFEDESIRLEPQPHGHYIAKSHLLPVALLAPELGATANLRGYSSRPGAQKQSPRPFGPGRALHFGCAGQI